MAVKKKSKGHKKGGKGKKDQKQKVDARAELDKIRDPTMEKLYESASKENQEYKVRIESLIKTIDNLHETCREQDNDALEVISTLQRESESKDTKIKLLEGQMDTERENARLEKESIIKDYENQLAELRDILREKETSLKVIKDEFNVLKDFRRKRRELMQELERKNNDMIEIERTNKDKIERLEKKFFEEKVRLQKETNKKLAELASKAHQEAILNLKQTTKEVYKENLRMADALRYHVMEGEDLHKLNNQLSITNKQLLEEKDLNSIIVKEKIMQSKKQNDQIKDLQNKVMSMEYTLSHIVREFDQEKEIISKLAKQEIDKVRYTVDTLKSELDIRIKQMKQIRRIAQHILDQRTDLETFFMDALDHVRLEICREREEKRRREAEEYNKKIKSVLNPRAAERLEKQEEEEKKKVEIPKASKVDITHLSWKDKERVLRVLFAKMNGIAMQGADGREENKISGGDYDREESKFPQNQGKQAGDEGVDVEVDEEGEEYDDSDEEEEEVTEMTGDYSLSSDEEISDNEKISNNELNDSDNESTIDMEEYRKRNPVSDKPIMNHIKKQMELQSSLEDLKRALSKHSSKIKDKNNSNSNNNNPQDDNNNNNNDDNNSGNAKNSNNDNINDDENESEVKTIPSEQLPIPHPPPDEPTNKQSINNIKKKRSGSSSSKSNSNTNLSAKSNKDTTIDPKTLGIEGLTEVPTEDADDHQYIENAKEIMKSDESLNKFIEDGMDNIKKSEEELVAQSKESFDEFLKRSYSQVNEATENNEEGNN